MNKEKEEMTDKEIIRALFERRGIKFTEDKEGDFIIEEGYAGFYTIIAFKYEDGSLESIAAWE